METQKIEEVKSQGEIAGGQIGVGDSKTETKNEKVVSKEELMASFLENLNEEVKVSVLELRKLQLEYFQEEVKYYEEVHSLEMKYAKIFEPIFERRKEILKKQIPDFWFTVLLESNVVDLIEEKDGPILKHLTDVSLKYEGENSRDFTLEFHFEPNDYFSNSVLTKEYEEICAIDPKDQLAFGGPKIIKCKGCEIQWKEGKNITQEKEAISFFQFFEPPVLSKEPLAEEKEALKEDFEMGQYLKERVIPRAILYYTGEITEESDDSESESSGSSAFTEDN